MYKTRYDWVGKEIHCELCMKLKFYQTNNWYMHNPESVLVNETHKLLWDFEIQTDHLISAWRPTKKRTSRIVDFAISADHRVKLKEIENIDKYLDHPGKLKKLWNMKVTVIPVVIGAFGTITKGLVQGLKDLEIRGRVETIQTTALRSARILRTVLETSGNLQSLKLHRETIGLGWWKSLKWQNNNNNDNNNNNVFLYKKKGRTHIRSNSWRKINESSPCVFSRRKSGW